MLPIKVKSVIRVEELILKGISDVAPGYGTGVTMEVCDMSVQHKNTSVPCVTYNSLVN
jgi:hypothetical protein